MATLTPKISARAGTTLNLAQAAAAGGDQFANSGFELVLLTNVNVGAARTVTVPVSAAATAAAEGKTIGPRTIALAASSYVIAGPFPPGLHNDTNGMCQLTYSDSGADIKVEIIKFPPI